MTTPHVTEIPLPLQPVEHDPFADGLTQPVSIRAARLERELRRRRLEAVRRLLKTRPVRPAARGRTRR
jgi:hypothetical protein